MKIPAIDGLSMVLLCALCLALAPEQARAQDPDSARATLLHHGLCPGAEVQVSTTFAERFRGRCVMEDARLLVGPPGAEQPILYTAVDSIWMRGPATRPASITGAWVGAGLLGAVGAFYGVMFCAHDCLEPALRHGIPAAAAGALGGWAIGGLIGSRSRVWIRLYPR